MEYDFTISGSITSGKLDAKRLHLELSNFIPSIDGIVMAGDNFTVIFVNDLAQSDVDILNAVVVDHSGDIVPRAKFHASAPLIQAETIITHVSEWQVLAGVYVNPSFFINDLNTSLSIMTGSVKHYGDDFELRIVEVQQDGTRLVMTAPVNHGSMQDADWHTFEMPSIVPPCNGENVYQLEGRLNTSKSVSLRFCSIVLMEIY